MSEEQEKKKNGFGSEETEESQKNPTKPGCFLRNVLNFNSVQSGPFSLERHCRSMKIRHDTDVLGSSLFCPLIVKDAFLQQKLLKKAKLSILLNLV